MSDHTRHAAHVAELEARSASRSRLFDVRTVIGGLFVFYGVLIGGAGLFADDAVLRKAQGVNINLWTGLGMLALGLAFLLWRTLRPLSGDPHDARRTDHRPAGPPR